MTMTPNGTCVKCGAPAFVLGTSVECSTQSCKNFNIEFAASQKDLSKIKRLGVETADLLSDLSYYWIYNSIPAEELGLLRDRLEGPPKGNFIYSKEDLKKHGAVGMYAKKGSNEVVQSTIDPGYGILDKIEKDRRKP